MVLPNESIIKNPIGTIKTIAYKAELGADFTCHARHPTHRAGGVVKYRMVNINSWKFFHEKTSPTLRLYRLNRILSQQCVMFQYTLIATAGNAAITTNTPPRHRLRPAEVNTNQTKYANPNNTAKYLDKKAKPSHTPDHA